MSVEVNAGIITVRMTETTTFEKKYSLEEFAEIVGVDTDAPDLAGALQTLINDYPSEDYGVEDASDLLDDIIQPANFTSVTDRDWDFEIQRQTEKED